MAYAGDPAGAFAILDEKAAWMPLSGQQNTMGSWLMLALVIEGLVMLGEQSQAAQLYPLARELVATGAIALWAISRFTQTIGRYRRGSGSSVGSRRRAFSDDNADSTDPYPPQDRVIHRS
jgi:hypothetical protein